MAKKLQILVIVAALASLAACNTVSGVGRDLRALGTVVSDAAENNTPHRYARRAAPAARPASAVTPAATPAPAPAARPAPRPR
jgi:predicted small secreted protein